MLCLRGWATSGGNDIGNSDSEGSDEDGPPTQQSHFAGAQLLLQALAASPNSDVLLQNLSSVGTNPEATQLMIRNFTDSVQAASEQYAEIQRQCLKAFHPSLELWMISTSLLMVFDFILLQEIRHFLWNSMQIWFILNQENSLILLSLILFQWFIPNL